MFTGIIEQMAEVVEVQKKGSGRVLCVAAKFSKIKPGQSFSINGVCLTLTQWDRSKSQMLFFIGSETLRRSNLRQLKHGDSVNLERAVKLFQNSTRMDGHWVQGHVDGLSKILQIKKKEGTIDMQLSLESSLGKYCVEKGSIALNGVSLTLCRVSRKIKTEVSVQIIPYTWMHTNLRCLSVGNFVNVEVDLIAKYVEKLCQPYQKQLPA
jgi:riboflavin synthase